MGKYSQMRMARIAALHLGFYSARQMFPKCSDCCINVTGVAKISHKERKENILLEFLSSYHRGSHRGPAPTCISHHTVLQYLDNAEIYMEGNQMPSEIRYVHGVLENNTLGYVRAFPTEGDADEYENMCPQHKGIRVSCGNFQNGIWYPYNEEE